MDNFKEIKNNINERMNQYTDSRQPTGDEVRIAWLIYKVEKLKAEREILQQTIRSLKMKG